MSLPNMTKKELVKFLKALNEHPLPTDLLDYIEGKASDHESIKKHLETCEDCQKGLENLKAVPYILPDPGKIKELLKHSKPMPKPEKAPDKVVFGQVWITKNHVGLPNTEKYSFDIPLTVVITLGEEHSYYDRDAYKNIRIAPISEITSLASDQDLLLGKQEPPLFTKTMIEVWNEVPTLKYVLQTYIGTLSKSSQNNLKYMLKAEHTREELPVSIPRGFPIVDDDDPRLEYQAMEQKTTKPLSALPFQLIDEWEKEPVYDSNIEIKELLTKMMAKIEDISKNQTELNKKIEEREVLKLN